MHILRLVLFGIAIGVVIIFGVRFVRNPFAPAPETAGRNATAAASLSPEAARRAVEGQLGNAREYSAFFKGMQENFPTDYERLVDSFAERAQTTRAQSPDVYLAETLRGLRQSHGVLASKASVGALERVFEHQAKIVNSLAQSNPQLCADFLYGNAQTAFFQFSSNHRDLIGAMAQAGLDAILDGRSLNIARAPPGDEDFAALEKELEKKGLGKPEIEALLDGKTPDPPLSDAVMCKAGVVYFETLRGLPQDVRLKIYALAIKLLART